MMAVDKSILLSLLFLAGLLSWAGSADAARRVTVVQTNPAPPAEFSMGDTQQVTFSVTNTSTGGNAGERIYEMRFRISPGSTFNSSSAAPAGWTRTSYSTSSVTFRATSWANALSAGSSLDFVIVLDLQAAATDVTNERLRDARASYTRDTNFGNGINRSGRATTNNPGSWNIRALSIDSQITDLAGVPITGITAGNSFQLVMTITNNTGATQSSITTSPNPPSAVKTGTVTQSLVSTAYSPSPLTLGPGATGTITFTFSTNANDAGTIYFTAYARNGNGRSTSTATTSPVLSVGRFSAALSLSTMCQYEGLTITVTMTLTNNYTHNIINVTPNLMLSAGAPAALQTGPNPMAPNGPVPPNGGTFSFSWIYIVSGGNPGDLFTFSGSASGAEQTGGNPVRTTPLSTTGQVMRGGFSPTVAPSNTNADSTVEELTWTITNQGCAAVNSVSFAIPPGWTPGSDAYSLIGQYNPPNPGVNPITAVENIWQVSGTNPVVFSAPPSPPDYSLPQMTPAKQGLFSIEFSETPSVTGISTFTVRITDAAGVSVDRTVEVTVDAFQSGGKNDATAGSWSEDIR